MPEARFNDISYQRFLDKEKLMGAPVHVLRCTLCPAAAAVHQVLQYRPGVGRA